VALGPRDSCPIEIPHQTASYEPARYKTGGYKASMLQNQHVTKVNMALVKVASLTALPPGNVMQAEAGGNSYVVCNLDGELYAYDGICPHAGGPLGEGNLVGNILVCPWHSWEYDCRTGVNTFDDSVTLASFPVKTQGEDILIDV
jgi:nitrite reductase/ring-hydroxylating ferredoxin subunit